MLLRLELGRGAVPNFTANRYWYLVIDTVLSRMNIYMLLPDGSEHLTLTREIYANPTNYGIIEFRTHKWNNNDYRHYLESMLSIDFNLSFHLAIPCQSGMMLTMLASCGSIYYRGLMSTVKLKATGILQTNLFLERCHYSTRLCPALYYTYYYSHHNLSKSLS